MTRPRNLREALKGELTDGELQKIRAFDIVGDIAVIKLPDELLSKKEAIGRALMRVHRNVRTVLLQTSPVCGEFRTRGLEIVAGEPRTETVHRESGCTFKVDLARVYFSPRLAHERLRVASLVGKGEVVTNLFAGVGCYSIVMAKHGQARRVYSIDKNPVAFQYMCENIRMNKVGDRVVPLLGDAREVVEPIAGEADRVLMPLPELARDFFDVALRALKRGGGVIHFYDYGAKPDPFGPSFEFVRRAADEEGYDVDLLDKKVIRSYAPNCYHIVLDLSVTAA